MGNLLLYIHVKNEPITTFVFRVFNNENTVPFKIVIESLYKVGISLEISRIGSGLHTFEFLRE